MHVSGHACQEELKLILGLTKPKFFIPVHGEYKHLKKNVSLAESMGIVRQHIIIPEIGKILEVGEKGIRAAGTVPSGSILIDGLGVGDVGNVVLRDRKHLSEDGLIIVGATIDEQSNTIVAGPDIVTKGFIYVKESEALIDETGRLSESIIYECLKGNITDVNAIKSKLNGAISALLYQKTQRRPMVLLIIMKI